MSDWWWVIAIVGLAAVAVLYLRARGNTNRGGSADRPDGARARPDFAQDREDSRLAGMSAEDRAWEDASRRTDRETRETRARDADGPAGRGGA